VRHEPGKHWLVGQSDKTRKGLLTSDQDVKGGERMLSKIPIGLEKIKKGDLDKQILRVGMIAELDAVSLYEQMAAMTQNENIKKVLLDIAKEEKTHVGEFQSLLLEEDREQERELKEGKKEIEELTRGKE
jgi:rubrerythrin